MRLLQSSAQERLLKRALICILLVGFCLAQTQPPSVGQQKVLWQKLEASIRDIDEHLDGVMGVAIEDLTTGDHYFLHEDEVFAQASSIKIAVLADLYLQAQQGTLKLTDLYTVQSSDLVQDSDIMNGLTPRVTRVTLRDLATMMVAVSDNAATNVLIDHEGMQQVNVMLDSLGLTHTRLRRKMMDLEAANQGRENISTPREMMTLLDAIYHGKVLNKESTDDFFKVLSSNKDSFIPRDLPADLEDREQTRRAGSRPQRFRNRFCRGTSVCNLRDDVIPPQRARRRRSHQQGLARWRGGCLTA